MYLFFHLLLLTTSLFCVDLTQNPSLSKKLRAEVKNILLSSQNTYLNDVFEQIFFGVDEEGLYTLDDTAVINPQNFTCLMGNGQQDGILHEIAKENPDKCHEAVTMLARELCLKSRHLEAIALFPRILLDKNAQNQTFLDILWENRKIETIEKIYKELTLQSNSKLTFRKDLNTRIRTYKTSTRKHDEAQHNERKKLQNLLEPKEKDNLYPSLLASWPLYSAVEKAWDISETVMLSNTDLMGEIKKENSSQNTIKIPGLIDHLSLLQENNLLNYFLFETPRDNKSLWQALCTRLYRGVDYSLVIQNNLVPIFTKLFGILKKGNVLERQEVIKNILEQHTSSFTDPYIVNKECKIAGLYIQAADSDIFMRTTSYKGTVFSYIASRASSPWINHILKKAPREYWENKENKEALKEGIKKRLDYLLEDKFVNDENAKAEIGYLKEIYLQSFQESLNVNNPIDLASTLSDLEKTSRAIRILRGFLL